MRRRLTLLTLSVSLLVSATTTVGAADAAGPPPSAVARLRRDIVNQLAHSGARVRGAAVYLEGAGGLVNLRGNDMLPPASTQKLFTAAAALLRIGPDARLRTEVRLTPGNDLVLVGGGDPSLGGADLDFLASAVQAAGVVHVTGSLVVDDSRYDRARGAPGWKPTYVTEQSGPLSALAVDGNRWRRDGDFVNDPATANGNRFRDALARAGVAVDGPTSLGTRQDAPVVAAHDSPTIAELVRHTLKVSDNFMAEMLLKEVGYRAGDGSTAGGLAVTAEVARQVGARFGQGGDGSGLSALDRQSPWGEADLLRAMEATAVANQFRAALPVHCGDGTLRKRLCGTAAAGRVFAKTGTLPGVVTLAGYALTGGNHRVWFSFELSGARSVARARTLVDQAVLSIATSAA